MSTFPNISLTDIVTIVLDSPYSNFEELFKDNLKKHSPILSKLFSG